MSDVIRKILRLLLFILIIASPVSCTLPALSPVGRGFETSPVKESHVSKINTLFFQNNVANGRVKKDKYGRIQLKGKYQDEKEVDLAFSLAQTVVGIKWVSPVTPEDKDIRVKEWEQRFAKLFKRSEVLDTSAPSYIKNRYALVVGIGKFKDSKVPALKYTVQDAEDFYQFLTDPMRGAFSRNDVTLLTDEKATKDKIEKTLEKIKDKAESDDLVCVYMSSHGTPPNYFGGVFIVTYDSVVEKPHEKIWRTSISSKILEDFVQNIKSKRLIMIIDACYSSGAYKNVFPNGGKSLGIGDDEEEAYSISKDYAMRLLGAKDIVLEAEPQENEAEKRREYGKVLISASSANEKSWESETIENSYFTYYLIDGLEHYGGEIQSAFNHAKPRVKQRVRQEKGYDQTPQAMATHKKWNMNISYSGR